MNNVHEKNYQKKMREITIGTMLSSSDTKSPKETLEFLCKNAPDVYANYLFDTFRSARSVGGPPIGAIATIIGEQLDLYSTFAHFPAFMQDCVKALNELVSEYDEEVQQEYLALLDAYILMTLRDSYVCATKETPQFSQKYAVVTTCERESHINYHPSKEEAQADMMFRVIIILLGSNYEMTLDDDFGFDQSMAWVNAQDNWDWKIFELPA